MVDLDAEQHAFERAIMLDLANPAPRLIYADWLDEHGRHKQARWMRALDYVAMQALLEQEIIESLGVPVHLITRDSNYSDRDPGLRAGSGVG